MRNALGFSIVLLIFASCSYSSEQKDAIANARNIELRDSIFLAQHFDSNRIYSNPVCLFYNKKPLLKIGQRVSELPKELGYRFDPNLKFQEYYGVVTDYLSLSENFTIEQPTGSVNGIVLFAADAHSNKIFYLNGNWLFDTDTSRLETIRALNALRKRTFPCLPPSETLLKESFVKLSNKDFTESFELIKPKEDSSAFHVYHLRYSVSLNRR